jgi:hypothetical protein
MRRSDQDRAFRLASWLAAFVLPLLIYCEGAAQSGRRATQSSAPTNTTETPKNVEHKSSGPELSRPLTLLVARQPTSKHFAAEDTILASFVEHLSDYTSLKTQAIGDLKRSDAIKRARGETADSDRYVVLLEFTVDSFQEGTILLNSQDLIVEYSVLSPHTAREVTKGKVYFQNIGGGRLRKSSWPTGTPIKITTEATGIEAAEQLYASLVLKVGVKR